MEERFKVFTVMTSKIKRSIQKIKVEEMAEYNLKSPHVSCLYYLYKEGPMTSTSLCEICDEDKAAISRSIVSLEKMGYLKYASDSKKRYRAKIELTESGRQIGMKIDEKITKYLAVVSVGISEKERLITYRCLHKISENLLKICETYEK